MQSSRKGEMFMFLNPYSNFKPYAVGTQWEDSFNYPQHSGVWLCHNRDIVEKRSVYSPLSSPLSVHVMNVMNILWGERETLLETSNISLSPTIVFTISIKNLFQIPFRCNIVFPWSFPPKADFSNRLDEVACYINRVADMVF